MITDEQIRAIVKDEIENVTTSEMVMFLTVSKRIIELYEANKPKPEPVGYGLVIKGVLHATKDEAGSVGFVPIYTTPIQKPLSEDFLMNLAEECTAQFFNGVHQNATIHFARAVEQAHGIGVK